MSAPTSSGKTFISSYVIDRTVRANKTRKAEGLPQGRVAIVLPTKALVNQLMAQVRLCVVSVCDVFLFCTLTCFVCVRFDGHDPMMDS